MAAGGGEGRAGGQRRSDGRTRPGRLTQHTPPRALIRRRRHWRCCDTAPQVALRGPRKRRSSRRPPSEPYARRLRHARPAAGRREGCAVCVSWAPPHRSLRSRRACARKWRMLRQRRRQRNRRRFRGTRRRLFTKSSFALFASLVTGGAPQPRPEAPLGDTAHNEALRQRRFTKPPLAQALRRLRGWDDTKTK